MTDGAGIDVEAVRACFPALARGDASGSFVFADAPGGTQVPDSVIDAVAGYLRSSNANSGGAFATSRESDAAIEAARSAAADFVGARPEEVVFGPNMTTLAFGVSRSIGRTLEPGDEIVVTNLDHDANVAPWLLIAEDAGAIVRWVDIHTDDCTLDLGSLDAVLGPRTRVVAFTLASNATGSITAANEVVRRARTTGAIVVADAVHFAQHRAVDAPGLGVDILFCSPYKFFGPHLGVMYARSEMIDGLRPYKVRPAHDLGPDRWETGTKDHEALAGLTAAIEYLAWLGRSFGAPSSDRRRAAIVAGFDAIGAHESALATRFLEGAQAIPGLRTFGIADPRRVAERTPTFAVRLADQHPRATAEALGARGIAVWDGNYYALAVMERLGLQDSGGAVRIGFCHYNTAAEVDRVLGALAELA